MGVCFFSGPRKQNHYVFVDPSVRPDLRPSPEQLNWGTNDSGFPELTDGELSDLFEHTKCMADESPNPEEWNRRQVRFPCGGLLGFSSERGVVRAITRKSRAWRSGVEIGWFILQIDGKPFTQARLDRKRGGSGAFTITFASRIQPDKSFSMSRSIANFESNVSAENPI